MLRKRGAALLYVIEILDSLPDCPLPEIQFLFPNLDCQIGKNWTFMLSVCKSVPPLSVQLLQVLGTDLSGVVRVKWQVWLTYIRCVQTILSSLQ